MFSADAQKYNSKNGAKDRLHMVRTLCTISTCIVEWRSNDSVLTFSIGSGNRTEFSESLTPNAFKTRDLQFIAFA